MTRKIAGVTDEAVENATDHDWEHWLAVLDDLDGADRTHRELVAALDDAGVESPWWQQQLAVGYERERGMREPGETRDSGFQVGVQRTVPVGRERLWAFLTGADGRELWLGDAPGFALDPGTTYETADGTTGEVRTVAPGERLRLTWQPAGRSEPTTLQLTLSCPRNAADRTTLRVHHERLADGADREEMRAHWRAVLDRVEARLADDTP